MKMQEVRNLLAEKNKKKMLAKGAAVVTAASLLAGSVSVYYVRAQEAETSADQLKETESQEKSEKEDDSESILEKTIGAQVSAGNQDVDKEETVYVIADAKGNATEVIVSDWLKNRDGAKEIEDVSTLKEIENVKGDETFKEGAGDSITWEADGADIYYQGKTDQSVPVSVKVTYTLDGKEISPEELAGKSGHVGIRFDYSNIEKQKVSVSGKEEEVYVPFTVISGAMLSTDHFKNVSVENG